MIPITTSFTLGAAKTDAPKQLSEAAARFEAIFARQMLASARQAKFDNGGLFDNQGVDTFRQMMDERFADVLAERGALGLGKMIEKQLAAQVGTPPQQGEG